MRKFLQFIVTPIMCLGWLWCLIRSAFYTGMVDARNYLAEMFEEDE